MIYIDTINNRYPLTLSQIREENPLTSFSNDFSGNLRYKVVLPSALPNYNRLTQYLKEGVPILTGTNYTQRWEVKDFTPDELAERTQSLIVEFQVEAQSRLDAFAREKMYDDIKSLCDYAGDEDPIFNAEGTYGKRLRSQTWRSLYNILDQVKSGQIQMPQTFDDIEHLLPILDWNLINN